MKNWDYIIVGQGLAGTLLAYYLNKNGQKVLVLDDETEGGASRIAAGLINPITGRRIVKSWRIDEFLPVAEQTYREIESLFKIKIWFKTEIIRTLKNADEENEWQMRSRWEGYQTYCADTPQLDAQMRGKIKDFYAFAAILNAVQVDMPLLLSVFRQHLLDNNCFLKEKIAYEDLIFKDNYVLYKNHQARKIIFCEGAKGVHNPYFSNLPFNIDKGELLIVKIPNANFNKIFKNNISIIPLKNRSENIYWVGATNAWHSLHDKPTEERKKEILEELRNILNIDFEVIDHLAAFRPTVKDRRPFIGFHPNNPQMAIFNGFGTKGASLIPFWAKHFTEVLIEEKILDEDVNIARFYEKY